MAARAALFPLAAPPAGPSLRRVAVCGAAPTAGRLVVDQLLACLVRRFFGIPGGPAAPFYRGLGENLDRLRFALTRHEATAGHAADFYFRVSRRLAAAAVTAGPGITNIKTALRTALADGSAFFLLAATTPRRWAGKGCAQEMDVEAELAGSVKKLAVLSDPREAPRLVRHLVAVAQSGVPGPVALVVPADVGATPVVGGYGLLAGPDPLSTPLAPTDPLAVGAAARLIEGARRPLVLLGRGAEMAGAAVRQLVDLLGCKVATSGRAKGLYPDPPFRAGACGVLGLGGRPEAHAALAEADVVLLVGESLGDLTSCGFSDVFRAKRLVQIDVDPSAIGRNYPVEVGIVADARLGLEALIGAIDPAAVVHGLVWLPERLSTVEEIVARSGEQIMTPRGVMQLLTHLIPDRAHVLADIGAAAMCWSLHELRRTGRYYLPQKFGAMGAALDGVLGAALATQDPVVVLAGDAAFEQKNGAELRTAIAAGARYVAVIMSDSGSGMVNEGFECLGGAFPSPMFPTPGPIAAVARAVGASAFEARTAADLVRMLPAALAATGPAVIEVPIRRDPADPTPMSTRVGQLASFEA